MIDVYTREEVVTPSREHTLQNVLGGRWLAAGLISKETNSLFGSTIDAALGRSVLWIRVLLDAKSGDGHSPPPVQAGEYTITAGGTPELTPQVTVTRDPERGTVTIVGYARREKELRRLTRRVREKLNIPEDTFAKAIKHQHEFINPVQFIFQVDGSVLREVATIACNLFAYHDRDLFLREDFDGIRNFVRAGEPEGWSFVHPNTFPAEIGLHGRNIGPLDHLVCVHGDAKLGRVRALVCIFNRLQFVVELGATDFPNDFYYTYRVDQLSGQDRRNNEVYFNTIPVEFRLSQVDRTFRSAIGAIGHVIESRMPNLLDQITIYAYQDTFGNTPYGTVLTSMDTEKLAHKIVEYLAQAGLIS